MDKLGLVFAKFGITLNLNQSIIVKGNLSMFTWGETVLYFGLKFSRFSRFWSFSLTNTRLQFQKGCKTEKNGVYHLLRFLKLIFLNYSNTCLNYDRFQRTAGVLIYIKYNGKYKKQSKIFLKSLLTDMIACCKTNLLSNAVVINNLLAKTICFLKNNVLLRAQDNWNKTLKFKRANRVNWNPVFLFLQAWRISAVVLEK